MRQLENDAAKWRAVQARDRTADGQFVYSVKTTGVYCRPSCGARLANRANVRFYATPRDAERAGFRACKRCRPNAESIGHEQAAVVATACRLIERSPSAPGLEALAKSAGKSASQFHRVFKALTGVTPKDYALAHRSRQVQHKLAEGSTVTKTIYQAGFQSNARFYSTADKVLGMKPKKFRGGGAGVVIRFAVGQCSLGAILVAATPIGICAIALGDDPEALIKQLEDQFPRAKLVGGDAKFENWVAKVVGFIERPSAGLNLPLDIQGTAFQQRVWKMLCKVPCGKTTTYVQIAQRVGAPTAVRAVAGAIAANKIAVAIPCHRVVRTDGSLSGYRWGVARKKALIERERSQR